MSEDGIKASIIVPCHRAEAVLPECLAALLAQVAEFPREIIVVDNDAAEGGGRLREIVDRVGAAAGIRIVDEPVPGAYAARNAGLAAARGEYLAFTDADCRPDPDWLAGLVALAERPGVLAAGGEIRAAAQDGLVARYAREAGILSQRHALRHERGPFLQTASLVVRRDRARAVDGFDATLPTGGDADFCWRLARRWPGERLELAEGALVRHHHRESVGDLFRQFRRYGQADVLLARKWGPRPGRELARLALDVGRVVLAPLLALPAIPVALRRRDPLPVVAPFLRAVRVLGRRVGRLRARLRPGRLHRS